MLGTLIRKNFHYFFSLSFSLSHCRFYMMKTFLFLLFSCPADCCGSVVCFVSCKSSSSLGTERSCRWKNFCIFSDTEKKRFSLALSNSLTHSPSFSLPRACLTGDWWFAFVCRLLLAGHGIFPSPMLLSTVSCVRPSRRITRIKKIWKSEKKKRKSARKFSRFSFVA